MNDMKIRAGEQLRFSITQADPDSLSATFIAQSEDNTISSTVLYSNGVAWFEFNSPDTDAIGVYKYQVNENFPTGSPDIYPSPGGCKSGNCGFPTLEICESLTEGS